MSATSKDYNNAIAHVIFTADGGNSESYSLNTLEDNLYEGNKTFQVHIGEVEPVECSAVSNTENTVTVTILEDDCKSVKI